MNNDKKNNLHFKEKDKEINMIKAGIIGSTGYAGQELVRILTQHKDAEVVWYGSRSYIDQKYADVYRNMFQIVDAKCMDDNIEALADQVDVILLAQGTMAYAEDAIHEKIGKPVLSSPRFGSQALASALKAKGL